MKAIVPTGQLVNTAIKAGATTCAVGNHFVVTFAEDFIGSMATPHTDRQVWTTPAVPYVITSAGIFLTASLAANATPGNGSGMSLVIVNNADHPLVAGFTGIWTGGNYVVDATTGLQRVWGFATAEYGELFDGSLGSNGSDSIFAQSGGGRLLVAGDGGVDGFFGKNVYFRFSPASTRTFTHFPYKVVITGYLL